CALKPASLDEQTAAELLSGPLGGTDALGLRRLRRALQLLAAEGDDRLAHALLDPRDLTMIPDSVAAPARKVAALLQTARDAIAGTTLAERAAREDSVRILTAHRSKGLEWDVVVVAGVQEETWPDLRLRGSLLGVDELAEAAIGADAGQGRDVDTAMLAARLL